MSYLDDILTYSSEPWAHFRHLTQEVLAHVAAGIKIQPCKTKLLQSEMEYLGHRISKEGISIIPEYVQKIKVWPVPKTRKEVATFLGFAGYYRTFIPQYSALTNLLNGIKKAEKFMWIKEIEQDLIELKKGGIQAFLDFGVGDPFILTGTGARRTSRECRTRNRGSSDAGKGSVTSTSRITLVTRGNC